MTRKSFDFDALPRPSHLARIDKLGLRTVSYLNKFVPCRVGDDETRNEWLPRDIIGLDGKTLIVWREIDRDYSIAGWVPWHDDMFGGRYPSIHSALNWVERAIAIRAGTAKDFLGC